MKGGFEPATLESQVEHSTTEPKPLFKPINLTGVVLAISHFSSQARGTDGIPQMIIVKALPAIGDYVVQTFNSSFVQGIFPSSWKHAGNST